MAKHIFGTLDGIRGIAALAVVVLHYSEPFGLDLVPNGYLAVDLFFVMSGVVIAHAYESRIVAGLGVWPFLRARFIRLYPLYIAGTLITAVGVGAGLAAGVSFQQWTWEALAKSFVPAVFMLPTVIEETQALYPLNFPAWSLLFEFLVNVVFVVWLAKAATRTVIVVILGAGAVLAVTALAGGSLGGGPDWPGAAIAMPRVVFGFAIGMVLYRLHRDGRFAVPAIPPLALLLATGMFLILPIRGGIYAFLVPVVIFPAMIWFGIHTEPRAKIAGIFRWLGMMSYPIYTLHIPIMYVVRSIFEKLSGAKISSAPALMIALIAVLLAASWVAARYFDVPVRTWLLNRGARRKRSLVAA